MHHTLPKDYLLHNRYLIQEVLGQGGFGITYKAHDQVLELTVCIKELFIAGNSTRGEHQTVQSQNTKAFEFSDYIERFLAEARQLARFNHKNIVRVLDIFQVNNTAYMAMEYVEGVDLKTMLNTVGALNLQEAVPLMQQLMDAVEAIHEKDMLHRDIKPDNILIAKDNRVVLIDFGSARAFAEGKTVTQTTILTPGYAPPEQYSERAQRGAFSDIYSLGATLYFLLTGQKPYAVTDRVNEQMPAPHELNPKVSTQVSSAIMLAMQLKPQDRFQSVSDFRSALQQLSTTEIPSTKQSTHIDKKQVPPPLPQQEESSLEGLSKEETIIQTAPQKEQEPIKNKNSSKKALRWLVLIPVILLAGAAIVFGPQLLSTASNKAGIEWVDIPAGTFMMGSPATERGRKADETQHQVRISAFKMSKYEVTFEQYDAFCEATDRPKPDDGGQGRGQKPVQNVTWQDAKAFCDWAGCRLPTEAEWEYACRAGTQTAYNTGQHISLSDANIYPGFESINEEVGAPSSQPHLREVGSYAPNAFGLYDMHGNAWEWCADWYDTYPGTAQTDPKGPNSGSGRVGKGGSCAFGAKYCRSAFRNAGPTGFKGPELGFRVAKNQ